MKILICETTREEREKIVSDALEYGEIGCDAKNPYALYAPYIEGKTELYEINRTCRIDYQKDMEVEERGNCSGVFN